MLRAATHVTAESDRFERASDHRQRHACICEGWTKPSPTHSKHTLLRESFGEERVCMAIQGLPIVKPAVIQSHGKRKGSPYFLSGQIGSWNFPNCLDTALYSAEFRL